MRRAIPVVLEEDEGQYVATWYDVDLFGYWVSEQEALDDLCESIVGLWEVLKRESAAQGLGDALAKQWAFLQADSGVCPIELKALVKTD